MSIGFMPMSDDESDYTKRRIEESYDVGYVSGISEVVSVTAKELQELREYKSKVEKFVLRNKNIFLKIPVCQFVEILEKELEYKEER